MDVIINIGSRIMDVYGLGRMFRNFKNDKKISNIIVYTGEYHSEFYRKVLKNLGFDEIKAKKKYNRCLDVKELKQPFFRKRF